MNRSFVPSAFVIAAAALAITAGSAQAVFVQFNGVSPSRSVSLSKNSGGSYNNYTVGRNNLTGNASNPEGLQGDFVGFCIDINQSISSGNSYTSFSVTPLANAPIPSSAMGITKANYIAEMWANEFTGLNSSDKYAAFQVAIWEIINDSGLSLTGGTFRAASGTVRTLAQSFLSKLDGIGTLAPVYAIASPYKQDFVVPAPGAAGLALGGLLLGVSRRRRSR